MRARIPPEREFYDHRLVTSKRSVVERHPELVVEPVDIVPVG